jgi:hypothetical protein
VIIVVGAVVISKRRSTNIAAGTPEAAADAAAGPGPSAEPAAVEAAQDADGTSTNAAKGEDDAPADDDGKTAAETTKTT